MAGRSKSKYRFTYTQLGGTKKKKNKNGGKLTKGSLRWNRLRSGGMMGERGKKSGDEQKHRFFGRPSPILGRLV